MLLLTMQRGDVRVIELREEASLTFKAVQAFLVPRELLGKNFDGDLTAEFGVTCSINLSKIPPLPMGSRIS